MWPNHRFTMAVCSALTLEPAPFALPAFFRARCSTGSPLCTRRQSMATSASSTSFLQRMLWSARLQTCVGDRHARGGRYMTHVTDILTLPTLSGRQHVSAPCCASQSQVCHRHLDQSSRRRQCTLHRWAYSAASCGSRWALAQCGCPVTRESRRKLTSFGESAMVLFIRVLFANVPAPSLQISCKASHLTISVVFASRGRTELQPFTMRQRKAIRTLSQNCCRPVQTSQLATRFAHL